MKSAEFTMVWSERRVRKRDLATYRMHHPLVGRMQVDLQTLNVPQEEGRRMVVATADAGTTSAAALCLLAHTGVPTAVRTARQARRTETPGSPRDGADSRSQATVAEAMTGCSPRRSSSATFMPWTSATTCADAAQCDRWPRTAERARKYTGA
jgi:hypothetical protein